MIPSDKQFSLFELAQIFTLMPRHGRSPKIKLCDRQENDVFSVLALYCDNNYLILYGIYKQENHPTVRQMPWHDAAEKEVVAMCLDPSAYWLLCCTPNGQLVLIPVAYFLFNKADNKWNRTEVTIIDLREIEKPSFWKRSQWKIWKTDKQEVPTSVVWWCAKDQSQVAIIGHRTGKLTFINLLDKIVIHSVNVSDPVVKLHIFEPEGHEETNIMVSCYNNKQWQVRLAYKAPPSDTYTTILAPGIGIALKTQPYLINSSQKHQKLFLPKSMKVDCILKYDTSQNMIEVQYYGCVSCVSERMRVISNIHDIVITDKLTFVLQRTASQGDRLVLLSTVRSYVREKHKDNMPDSILQEFSIPEGEQVIGLFHLPVKGDKVLRGRPAKTQIKKTMMTLYGQGPESPAHMSELIPDIAHLLDCYVIVTTTSIYVCQDRMSPEQLFMELALDNEMPSKLTRLADMLDLETDDMFLKIAEHFLNEEKIDYVLEILQEAKFNPIQKASLLGRKGYLKHMLSYLKSLSSQRTKEDVKSKPTDFERWVLSNLAVKTLIQQYLLHSYDVNLKRLLRDFLDKDNRFDLLPAIQLLIKYGLFDFLLNFCKTKGYLIDMLHQLMETGPYIMQWQNQTIDTLENYDLLNHFNRTNDAGFLSCLTTNELSHCLLMHPDILQQYLVTMEQMLSLLPEKILIDLATIFDLSSLRMRTLALMDSQCKLNASELKKKEYKVHIGSMSNLVHFYNQLLLTLQMKRGFSFESDYLNNAALQLTNESQDNSPINRQITHQNQMISCGMFHAAMVCKGEIYTWGADMFGRLGHDDLQSRRTVGKLEFPSRIYCLAYLGVQVKSVSCGCSHTMAITNYGVFGWGSSRYGQLGLGFVLHECIRPVLIEGATRARCISLECGLFHTIAINEQRKILTWGYGLHGQLGHRNTMDQLVPTEVKYLDNIKAVAAGYFHSLVLTQNGTVYSFGLGTNGQLGLGGRDRRLSPVIIPLYEAIIQISSGYFHNVILSENNVVYSWGITPRILQQICNAATLEKKIAKKERQPLPESRCLKEIPEEYLTPSKVDISMLSGKIIKVTCGGNHSMILTDNGELYSWGINMDGQFGIGKRQPHLQEWKLSQVIKRPDNTVPYVYMSCGMDFTIAINAESKIWGWGRNDFRQLGQIANDNQGAISSGDHGEGRPRSRRILGICNITNTSLGIGNNSFTPKRAASLSPNRLFSSPRHNQQTTNSPSKADPSIPVADPFISELNLKCVSISPRRNTSSWVTELISRSSNKRQSVSSPLELHGLTCALQGVSYTSSFKAEPYISSQILQPQDILSLDSLDEKPFGKNALQSVIKFFGTFLTNDDLIGLCIKYSHHQMAAKLSMQFQDFTQALKWQFKAIERHKHEICMFEIAPSTVAYYLRELQELPKPVASTSLKEFINEVIDFWMISGLPASELEKVFQNHLNLLAPELINYLHREDANHKNKATTFQNAISSEDLATNPGQEQIKFIDEVMPISFKFSTKFCLQVASTILKKMSSKQLTKEDCQTVARFAGRKEVIPEHHSEIPDDKLWQEIVQHLQKDINRWPHIHLSQSYIDFLERTLRINHSPWFVKEESLSNTLEEVHLFTCGHHFTKQNFNSLVLPKFEDSMKILNHPLPQVTKILMTTYHQDKLVPMACPKCILGVIKETSG